MPIRNPFKRPTAPFDAWEASATEQAFQDTSVAGIPEIEIVEHELSGKLI
jgi:hypothetical protein